MGKRGRRALAKSDNLVLIYGVKPAPKPMVSRWLDEDSKQVPLDVSCGGMLDRHFVNKAEER